MPNFFLNLQDFLFYTCIFFVLLVLAFAVNGNSNIKIFEKRHLSLARFTSLLIFLNFAFELVLVIINLIEKGGNWLNVEVILLFFACILGVLGVSRARTNFTHGKKFRALLVFFGLACVLLVGLLVYKLLSRAGYTF